MRGASSVPQANLNQQLFVLRGADMHVTTDQQFTKVFSGTNYVITHVLAKRVSGGATVTCAGGIYSASSKGGDALVAAAQSWIALSGASTGVSATVAAVAATTNESATPYLSLTTGSTAAVTADIFIFGVCID